MSFISSFDIISVAGLLPEPKIFLCIPAFAADAGGVNHNGIKTLFANGLISLFIKVILFLIMNEEVYQENLLIYHLR